jgi:hypothetical protein
MAYDDLKLRTLGVLLALALAPTFWPTSAGASPENRDEICQGYQGTVLWGQCTRAVVHNCQDSTLAAPQCARWANDWQAQTGTQPPWLVCGGDGSCTVFVTSETFPNGNLGGLEAADTECNSLASSANLSGEYKAWLSDSGAGESPTTRFSTVGMRVPYVLANAAKTRVADSWAALTDGSLDAAISVDELGASPEVVASGNVWTGTLGSGVPGGADCFGWTAGGPGGGFGYVGVLALSDVRWTLVGLAQCTQAQHLYCFEQ